MAYIFVLLADIANGLIALFGAGYVTGVEVVWWHALIGIPLAMLPDLDAVPELLRRGKVGADASHATDHREYLHAPLIFIALGAGLAVLVGYWGYVFLFAVTLHFINDFYGTGWGISLFAPFSKRRYKLCSRKVNRLRSQLIADGDWQELQENERRFRLIVSWTPEELVKYIPRWGDDDWMNKWYRTINWVSGVEYVIFIITVVLFTLTVK